MNTKIQFQLCNPLGMAEYLLQSCLNQLWSDLFLNLLELVLHKDVSFAKVSVPCCLICHIIITVAQHGI